MLRLSSRAISSRFCVIRSPSFQTIRPRSAALIRGHGPESKALRAAATARSTSRSSPRPTRALGSSVAGLIVSYVEPEAGARQVPAMKSCPVFMM